MCNTIGEKITNTGMAFFCTVACPFTGVIDHAVRITATVASIFEFAISERVNKDINKVAKDGIFTHSEEAKPLSFKNLSLKNVISFSYLFLLSLAGGEINKKYKALGIKEKWPNLADKLQTTLFVNVHSLRDPEQHNLLVREVGSRLAFFGSTLLILVAKIGQLALGILMAAISLLTLDGIFGYLKPEAFNFLAGAACSHLRIDFLETLCDGLRYIFYPDRAADDGYSSKALQKLEKAKLSEQAKSVSSFPCLN